MRLEDLSPAECRLVRAIRLADATRARVPADRHMDFETWWRAALLEQNRFAVVGEERIDEVFAEIERVLGTGGGP